MRRNNPVERRSLQEQSRRQMMEDEDLKVPLYAEDRFKEEVKKREHLEQIEIKNKKNEELMKIKKQEREEYKNKLIPFIEINGYLLSICAIMLMLGVTSVFMLSFYNVIYSIIGIISTIYIGRRIRPISESLDETTNILIWNISQTLNDFVEYKINYDIKASYEGVVAKSTICLMGSLLFLNSNNIIYGLSLLALIMGILMSIAYRDIETITCVLNKLLVCAIVGLFIKAIFSYFVLSIFTIDFFNVVLINLFVILNMLKDIEIKEPII